VVKVDEGYQVLPTDLDLSGLETSLAGRVVGSRILYYRTLASTMDEARKLAEEGVGEGTVVVAEEQSAGRGRFGRAWVSSPGKDLSFSVVLRPSDVQLSFVNMAATLAVSETVAEFTGATPVIKWPNDVQINGLKVSGVLMESVVESGGTVHTIVGIGLNVNLDTDDTPQTASIATSLYKYTGKRRDRTPVMKMLLERLDELYAEVRNGVSLTDRWAAKLDTLGRIVTVRWQNRVFEGRACCVDGQGNLLVEKDDGSIVTVVAGEVTLR
jgi:BirA family biotin operon repressor/biotin-[acetyl-CoA-carboxylase] ligase